MDEIKERLQATSQNCFVTYEAWSADKKDTKLQEDLQDAVHELRRVASRLEIEMSVNERSAVKHNMTNETPNGRSQRGNSAGDNNTVPKKPRGRRPSTRKPSDKSGD